ncbi:MAG: tetratricopeptide repeat protein [Elusimicrobia bacterium]|nr:tetratricopeptide repeat protein [Elusimicrobiota bacterium]
MGKQWAKQQIRRNELQESVEKTITWVAANREKVLLASAGLVAAVLTAGLLVYRGQAVKSDAWDKLSMAQAYAFSGRAEESLKQLADIAKDSPGADASGFAAMFEGDILYRRASYKEAVTAYSKIIERGTPKTLQPFALADIGISQESAGAFADAAATSRRFLETYPDHFLAPQVSASLARCQEELKEATEARATYQRISLQYPETAWAGWASAKLQGKQP